jgi:hypothetical protein
MNKKILTAFIAITLSLPISAQALLKSPVAYKAEIQPATLAILDTALDTSLPIFKDKIIYEVCIMEWPSCPNGKTFMEGTGSSVISQIGFSKNGFDHGTQMASAAIQTNPNMKILFVRIIGQNINYDKQISTEATLYNALNWVYNNKDKFNIKAVSLSQGNHNLLPGTNYCTSTPKSETAISNLLNSGVPIFMAAGNSRDYTRIDWPACIPQSVAIGAGTKNGIELYSNHDNNLTDFYANGNMKVFTYGNTQVNVAGTSISAQVAAASWISLIQVKPTLTFQQAYDLFSKTSTQIKGKQGFGKLMNVGAAING